MYFRSLFDCKRRVESRVGPRLDNGVHDADDGFSITRLCLAKLVALAFCLLGENGCVPDLIPTPIIQIFLLRWLTKSSTHDLGVLS